MASSSAKAVARELLEKVGKKEASGKRITLGAILLKHGYAPNTAKNPKQVTETKSFQDEVAPTVEKLRKLHAKILARMDKTVDKASFGNLPYALHTIQENISLLTGKPTSIQFGAHIDLTPDDEAKIRRLLS